MFKNCYSHFILMLAALTQMSSTVQRKKRVSFVWDTISNCMPRKLLLFFFFASVLKNHHQSSEKRGVLQCALPSPLSFFPFLSFTRATFETLEDILSLDRLPTTSLAPECLQNARNPMVFFRWGKHFIIVAVVSTRTRLTTDLRIILIDFDMQNFQTFN